MERVLAIDTLNLEGTTVKLQGWVENLREMGKISFLDLRDRSGKIQCVYSGTLKDLSLESVIEVEAEIKKRPEKMINPDLITGSVEAEIKTYTVLNKANALPIPVSGEGYEIKEESRLRYRYIDLRRNRLHSNIKLRSQYTNHLRDYFMKNDFIEIETPILTKATMEGARDFVVPSRLQPGKFYALPQSPQQYKQLLMTAGFERYFQIAKCIRDENLRADRGFEFTQVDLEMSFVDRDQVMRVVEEGVKYAVKNMGGKLQQENFPIYDYKDAMEKFGADKFDLRTEEEKKDGTLAFAWVINFPFFKKVDREDVAEMRDGKSGWTFTHNPFSMPMPEHLEWHLKGENVDQIITTQYDLVCNGLEVGGGSIRAHRSDILKATFKTMGYSDDEIQKSVGHMLEAFDSGTPPHGGIGLGLDRQVALLAGESSIKEAISFPMSYTGNISIMDAPSEISEEQFKDLGIELRYKKPKDGKGLSEAIRKLLSDNNVDFEYLEHEPTPTSEDSARVRGTKLEEGAKALILKGKKSGTNYLIVIQSHLQLDTKKVKAFIGEDVEFEKPEVILEKYGVQIGGVPPFGNLIGIKVLLDEKILELEKVAFNSGTQTTSITMKSKDLLEYTKAEKGDWTK